MQVYFLIKSDFESTVEIIDEIVFTSYSERRECYISSAGRPRSPTKIFNTFEMASCRELVQLLDLSCAYTVDLFDKLKGKNGYAIVISIDLL